MEIPVSETFRTCREALTGDGPHRVWSLIVTIFGDMAQAPGACLSGAQISAITEIIDIRPEAMRVALHRLRKDGWIESRREGRASLHFLTEFGRAQSAAASPRIYGPELPDDVPLHVLVAEDGAGEARRELEAHAQTDAYLQIGGNILVGLGDAPSDAEGLLVVETAGPMVPDWVQERVCSPELVAESVRLLAALELVADALDGGPALSPLEAAALRTLLVHSWRRLLLRHPNLPPRFFPKGWRGAQCRVRVQDLLARLPVQSPGALASL